jgi:hypothetical protein
VGLTATLGVITLHRIFFFEIIRCTTRMWQLIADVASSEAAGDAG